MTLDRNLLTPTPAISLPTNIRPLPQSTTGISLPHFDLPFRMNGSSAAVVQQDTLDDVYNCVVAAAVTDAGTRKELPDFGVLEPTFSIQPVDTEDMMARIVQHEPRAELTFDQNPNVLDELIAEVSMYVVSTIDRAEQQFEQSGGI